MTSKFTLSGFLLPPQLTELGIIGIALTDAVRVRTSDSRLNGEQVQAIACFLVTNERTSEWASKYFNPHEVLLPGMNLRDIIDPFGFIQLEDCKTCVN